MLSDGVPLTFDTEFIRRVHYEVTCRHCDERACVCVCVSVCVCVRVCVCV